jgi:cell division transport system ATP-binding protein
MMGTVAVSIRDVDVYQGKNLVLSKVSLEVAEGEFLYLIGKTGSGKSSLLKMLYADLALSRGEIELAGFRLSDIKEKDIPFLRRKLGIVFQDFRLLTDRSVNDNLLFVMMATGWNNKDEMMKRAQDVLSKVGLTGKGGKMPHELSGGEQQRVGIARALINHPLVILADEPTGNLDPATSEEIIELLFEISRSGTAVIVATHDVLLFKKFPERTLRCENGAVIQPEG